MANIKGIIFSDLFINNKDIFVKFFTEYYYQNEKELNMIINELDTVLQSFTTDTLNKKTADKFKIVWEKFEKNVLLNNNDLQLLTVYRGASGKDGRYSKIIPQNAVEGEGLTARGKQYGIQSGHNLITDSMKALEASEIEGFLQKHMNDFLNQLETSINKNQAYLLHKYHTWCLNDSVKKDNIHLTGLKFREAFYSKNSGYYFGGQGLGKAYDAYMNHMADKETWIYDYLKLNGKTGPIPSLPKKRTTVYSEEGGVLENANFPRLLKNSMNSTGWYTGGDIVIINKDTMSIVYNIQLKTTTEKTQSIFGEKVAKIRTFINLLVNDTPEEKANRIFDFFLTSISNETDFNGILQQDIDELLKKSLKQKYEIDLTF